MSKSKAPALETFIALVCGLFLTSSCSPIKPGGGSSAEAQSTGATENSNGSAANNSSDDSNDNSDLGSDTQVGDGEGSADDNAVAQNSSNSQDLAERYNFAAVCGPLFGMGGGAEGAREAVLSNEGGDAPAAEAPADAGPSAGGCLEGPDISSFRAVQAFSEFDQRKANCVAANGFWDPRGEDSDNPGENGECFDVSASSAGLFCDFSELENQMSDVFGIDGFIEGYQNLGWQVEQCVFSPTGPYLTLSTVVIDQTQDQAFLISKVAFLESISTVCDGKSGGVCDQVEDDPNAEVLFVSAPLTISSKTVADFNAFIAEDE
ncbi:MAG: hypothetical protein HRU09_06480 [Oligoflexales bacterium]|nr:hypothetical protein [Oligoflexales bacterium]